MLPCQAGQRRYVITLQQVICFILAWCIQKSMHLNIKSTISVHQNMNSTNNHLLGLLCQCRNKKLFRKEKQLLNQRQNLNIHITMNVNQQSTDSLQIYIYIHNVKNNTSTMLLNALQIREEPTFWKIGECLPILLKWTDYAVQA